MRLGLNAGLLVAVAWLVSACASLPPPSISAVDLGQYHIAAVEVRGAEAMRAWPHEEEVFVRAKGLDENAAAEVATRPLHENAELRAHAAHVLGGLLKADFTAALSARLSGPRPVRAVVTVTHFDIPSLARRIFTDQVATMAGRVALVDATGAIIVESPELRASAYLMGGLSSPIASAVESSSGNEPGRLLARNFAAAYRGWLLQS